MGTVALLLGWRAGPARLFCKVACAADLFAPSASPGRQPVRSRSSAGQLRGRRKRPDAATHAHGRRIRNTNFDAVARVDSGRGSESERDSYSDVDSRAQRHSGSQREWHAAGSQSDTRCRAFSHGNAGACENAAYYNQHYAHPHCHGQPHLYQDLDALGNPDPGGVCAGPPSAPTWQAYKAASGPG